MEALLVILVLVIAFLLIDRHFDRKTIKLIASNREWWKEHALRK